MGLFDRFRRNAPGQSSQDSAFASLMVGHAFVAAEECLEEFLFKDNCDDEEDVMLMHENLFTIYIALVFACLREFDLEEDERAVLDELHSRFPNAGKTQKSQTTANIYRLRDHLHPATASISFEELKDRWPLLIRSLLHDYHQQRFGRRSFLAIVDDKKTAEHLVQHVGRVEAHCKIRSEARGES